MNKCLLDRTLAGATVKLHCETVGVADDVTVGVLAGVLVVSDGDGDGLLVFGEKTVAGGVVGALHTERPSYEV